MGKKSKKKKARAGLSAFEKMVGLIAPILLSSFILLNFQTTITSVPLFKILITLGGLQTYFQGVIMVILLILIIGTWIIAD